MDFPAHIELFIFPPVQLPASKCLGLLGFESAYFVRPFFNFGEIGVFVAPIEASANRAAAILIGFIELMISVYIALISAAKVNSIRRSFWTQIHIGLLDQD